MLLMMAAILAAAVVIGAQVVTPNPSPAAPSQARAVAGAFVLAGDSITDGRYAPDGEYAWWRDGVAVQLEAWMNGFTDAPYLVVKHGGGCIVATTCAGPPVAVWLTAEVLDSLPKPTTILLQFGWNDLGRITDAQYTAGILAIADMVHAADGHLLMGEVNPSCLTAPNHALNEPQRKRWNLWLRDNFGPDLVPFSVQLALPDGSLNPAYALAGCKPGTDFIHLGVLGVYRMVRAVRPDQMV
jgi:hypothetical protein